MNLDRVCNILHKNDGSLPDINFDFGSERVAGVAYTLIQGRAKRLSSPHASYWSEEKGEDVPIRFGDNPALALLDGDTPGFHVVFGAMQSASGAPIPDLGVFVQDAGKIALDYRMGAEWNEAAIIGLFEIMRDLTALATGVRMTHTGNIFDLDDDILLTEFVRWLELPGGQAGLP